ncbi:hypothetical protein AC249_AIPGENE7956 [Exaiptasia diaphana]|nr:hypothetical protein AC249_AIPGENE7956 [Exaiptasia diaphana]
MEYSDIYICCLYFKDRDKPTVGSSSVGKEHYKHSSCDLDLPRVTMTGLAWNDWVKVREIYIESSTESSKRRKAEKKVAELAHELHILENERQPLVSERIVQLQSELQRIQHEREEVNRENVSLKNKLDEVTSKLLAEQELLSNQLDPLLKSKPKQLLKVFQQLTSDLISEAPETLDMVERLMSELSMKIVSNTKLKADVLIQIMQGNAEVLQEVEWCDLDDGSKTKLILDTEIMMNLVTEELCNLPNLSTDESIRMIRVLKTLPWELFNDDIKAKLISGIEAIMSLVHERLGSYPNQSIDELIQMMQANAKVLQQLPWNDLDDGSKMKLTSGIETIMTSVIQRFDKHPDLSIDELIQVMQENTKVLEKLPWENIDEGSKMKLTSYIAETMMTSIEAMMTSVADRLVKHPNLTTDVLIQVMQENAKVLKKQTRENIDDDSEMKVTSGIEDMMTSIADRLVKHPDLSTDVLIQVMTENTKMLQTLPWYHLNNGSKMKLTSGIGTMMASVADRLVNHPDLSTDELIQLMQENTKVLQQLRWYLLDGISKMKLTSAIETLMNSITKRLDNHSDLTTDVLIKVMQENTKVLEKLPWENIDDDSKFKLSSDLESMIKHVIQHLSKHPEISNDVFKGILCISEAILKKISWTDLNSDLQNHVLSCLAELMELVSGRALHHGEHEVLTDAVSIILAMSSLLPQSSDITSRLQSNLEAMVGSVEKLRGFRYYDLSEVIEMITAALNKLADNKLSSEATLVILSIASLIITADFKQNRMWFERDVTNQFMSLLRDVKGFLPENLPSASDATELKSHVVSYVDILDRVLLHFDDIQVKSTEIDQPFILDEVVSDIKEELSKLKKELANMIHIFGK